MKTTTKYYHPNRRVTIRARNVPFRKVMWIVLLAFLAGMSTGALLNELRVLRAIY